MAKLILALDFGSTGAKVTVFNEKAEIVAARYREYPTYFPQPYYVMQSPREWWEAFVEATKELLALPEIDPADIAVVAPSAQMSSAIPIDKDGNLLVDPVWIWADMRSKEQVKRVCEALGGEENLYNITGGAMDQETYTGFKIAWIKENMPELYEKTHKFLQVKEFISWKLTGNMVTDYSDASDCAMMDIRKKEYSPKLLELYGIDPAKMPPIQKGNSIMGFVTEAAAKETGIPAGTPVSVGGGDVTIAAMGAGVAQEGEAYIYIGSGAWMGMYSAEPNMNFDARLVNFLSVDGQGYLPHVMGFCGGIAHRWMRDLVNNIPGLKDAVNYDTIEELVKASPVGAKGLLFMPFLRGGGAPYNEVDARGCFLGLELTHDYADFCRAVMEGTAYVLRSMLEQISANAPGGVKKITMIGGGAKDPVWTQIIANVLQREITITTMTQEANSWGAAICGGVAVGIWDDIASAQALVQVERVDKPQPETAAIYDRMYAASKLAFDRMLPMFHELADIREMLAQNNG